MATAVKRKLSGSTDGKGILVAATATPGTAVHTAVAGTTAGTFDEIWLWATNTDTTDQKLTIEFAGTSAGFIVEVTIPAESGPFLVVPGWILQNAGAVAAFAATTNVINIHGYVNAITD